MKFVFFKYEGNTRFVIKSRSREKLKLAKYIFTWLEAIYVIDSKMRSREHVKDVVLRNRLLSEHQGFLYRKTNQIKKSNKKKNRQWKSLAEQGKNFWNVRADKSSSVVKSLTDLRVMINVMCAFEETQQSDAKKKKKGGETLVRSSYTGWYDRGGREKKSLTSQVYNECSWPEIA